MGAIFSKTDDKLVELCRIWSADRTTDPLTGEEFTDYNHRKLIEYEIACMNIINGAYDSSPESKHAILENLDKVCTSLSDPILFTDFEEMEQDQLNNIVLIKSKAEDGKKGHCFLLETIAENMYRQHNEGHAMTNPYTNELLQPDDITRILTMLKLKAFKLVKA